MTTKIKAAHRPPFVRENVALRLMSSWKVGGSAQYFVQPENINEVVEALNWASSQGLSWTVIGGGTNVLIRDGLLKGLVVSTRALNSLDCKVNGPRFEAVAGAGCRKSQLFKSFLKHELVPAEFLSGLPGDVGGGVVMNAGVSEKISPREFCEITDWIDVVQRVDDQFLLQRISSGDLSWSYRHCNGWQPGVIVKVGMSWPMSPKEGLRERVKDAALSRKARQPLDLPSCGSVFVNPPGDKAGRLIEASGLKGKWFGGAQVSEKHANFIVNRGEATAQDIETAIRSVQKTVQEMTGINLDTEVVFLGEPQR